MMMSRVCARAAQAVREGARSSSAKVDRAQQQSMARAGRSKSSAAPQQAGKAAAEEARRRMAAQEEESLRTVMFLSMWGPNT